MNRSIALAALLVAATSCTAGLDAASEALSGSPALSPSSVPGVGTAPTPAPDGRPAVIVTSPASGEELSSPVVVSGRAFVDAGEVTITVLDETGTPLASTRTEVGCGEGCRGRFEARLAFFAQQRIAGAVVVFEVSAQGGYPVNVVSIPVTFEP